MRHLVTPSDTQDAMKTAAMKLLQGLDVVAVSYPGFTAEEEGDDADCLVDTDFCVQKVFCAPSPSTMCSVWTVEPSATAV